MSNSAKVVHATVEFVDIAGLVQGASQGEGLGNRFLAHIRESAAICQVTRVFRDDDVTHVDGEVNPGNDISTIQTELILADLETVAGDPVAASPRQILQMGVVQVPQNHSLFKDMTVRENIELGGYILSDRAKVASRVDAVTTRRSIKFSSWRTLPGQSQFARKSRASGSRPASAD